MTETNRIEFKERLTRDLDIEKEVVAFLNYREGGILYSVMKLTKRQQHIYQFIRNSSSYSSTSEPLSEPLNTTYISQHLNIALATLKRDLQVLVEKQFIHRVGGRKNGHWEVTINSKSLKE